MKGVPVIQPKIAFCFKQLIFLGYILTAGGIFAYPEKRVQNWKPADTKGCQGRLFFYRSYIHQLISSPT